MIRVPPVTSKTIARRALEGAQVPNSLLQPEIASKDFKIYVGRKLPWQMEYRLFQSLFDSQAYAVFSVKMPHRQWATLRLVRDVPNGPWDVVSRT